LLGQKYMPGKLLILPSNGRLSASIYVVSLSGTGSIPPSAVGASFNVRLKENYFSGFGLVRSDAIVQLESPVSVPVGSFQWSITTRLSDNGAGSGILRSEFFVTVSGVVHSGVLYSNFNHLVEPLIQLSAEVEFAGTLTLGDSFSASMTQFSLNRV
jgi:hypothetical protein